ncbi:hypothetical protein TYRP_013586 [Tyrophagus putrescentiae]|nr:hypothetical protein TYRP_013586 [Tyrophagus putrescentiae]
MVAREMKLNQAASKIQLKDVNAVGGHCEDDSVEDHGHDKKCRILLHHRDKVLQRGVEDAISLKEQQKVQYSNGGRNGTVGDWPSNDQKGEQCCAEAVIYSGDCVPAEVTKKGVH